jgi:hypothetical protein
MQANNAVDRDQGTLLFRKEAIGHFLRNIFFGQKTQLDRSADEKIVFHGRIGFP